MAGTRNTEPAVLKLARALFPVASASRRPKETNGEAEAEDAAARQTERPG
jgi:hypothetical protein